MNFKLVRLQSLLEGAPFMTRLTSRFHVTFASQATRFNKCHGWWCCCFWFDSSVYGKLTAPVIAIYFMFSPTVMPNPRQWYCIIRDKITAEGTAGHAIGIPVQKHNVSPGTVTLGSTHLIRFCHNSPVAKTTCACFLRWNDPVDTGYQ